MWCRRFRVGADGLVVQIVHRWCRWLRCGADVCRCGIHRGLRPFMHFQTKLSELLIQSRTDIDFYGHLINSYIFLFIFAPSLESTPPPPPSPIKVSLYHRPPSPRVSYRYCWRRFWFCNDLIWMKHKVWKSWVNWQNKLMTKFLLFFLHAGRNFWLVRVGVGGGGGCMEKLEDCVNNINKPNI